MGQLTINFDQHGHGIPLVLVHGFPLDGRMWDAVIPALSKTHRVIVPDLPGFGRSPAGPPFSIDSLADALLARLDAVEAVPCVLAGLSMGGYIALSFALRRGLMLVDTRAESDTPQGRMAREEMIRLVRAFGSDAIADKMLPRLIAPETASKHPEVVSSLRKIMESCSPAAIEHALAAMRDRPDRTPDLASIAAPTLILVGDADAITPPSIAREMGQRIQHSEVRVIPGAGHMSPMEQPAEVSRVMLEWLGRSTAIRGMGVPPMSAGS
jgi:3-oxoadipate enol-lactonase